MKPRKTSLIRNSSLFALLIGSVVFFTGCKKDISTENPDPVSSTTEDLSASVGAQAVIVYEGFGAAAVGGANSTTVYHVTNLNSSGSGSLSAGIGSNKTIVFDVSGTIQSSLDLVNVSYLTIDATGRDITIANTGSDGISFDGTNTHHCIVKGIHVTNAGGDGINVVSGAHDIMITNCSAWNNQDGNIDVAGDNSGQTKNVTIQYCIIGPHSGTEVGGTLVTGQSVSIHHNLYSPASPNLEGERCPFIHANYSPVGSPNADVRNNVVWKFGRNNGTGSGYGTAVAYNATANVVGNYYYTAGSSPGSATSTSDGYGSGATGKGYMSGNVSANSGVNPNSPSNHAEYAIPSQYAVSTQDACTAASMVLANAGPSPRNSTDQGFINAVTLTVCGTTPVNQSPTVNAGTDKTITLPVSSVTLTGTASDPDGTVASYAWTKVSGTGGTITSVSAASTTVTGLTAGSYTFKLTVTDNKGATASDNVIVTVNGSTAANQPPTANAGIDKTIILPASSLTLAGSGSDPDGTIASYLWSKVSGPAAGTVTTPNAATTAVTGLTIAGIYVFSLKVTDNGGAIATDNVTVTVNAAVQTGGGYGTLTFSELYDASSSVNTAAGPRNSMSPSLYKTGPGSFRSEIRAGDANKRGEMIYTSTSQNSTEGVAEYDVYYENWNSLDGGGHTIEWLPTTSGAGAIVSLQNYGGKFDVVRAIGSSVIHQSGTLMTCASNTWYKMRWEYKWSTGTDGYVRLYINDVLYYTYTGQTADGSGQKLRMGQFRWPISGSTLNVTSVVYYDNLKVYTK